jgi:two-component system response regulator HydG
MWKSLKPSLVRSACRKMMKKEDWDVILLDMNFTKDAISGQEGFDALSQILEIDPNAVVVFITAYGDAEKAVKAIKMGATDFILKPWQNEKILATINAAISLRRTRLQAQNLKTQTAGNQCRAGSALHRFRGTVPGNV